MAKKSARTQRGIALLEFALLLPFISMLVMATIDLGRVYSLQHRLTNAAREGAAFAQYFPGQVSASGTCANPENITHHALGEDNGTASGFTVTVMNITTNTTITGPCTTSGITPGTKVKVTVSGTFIPITVFAKQFIGSPAIIRRSAEIVVQG